MSELRKAITDWCIKSFPPGSFGTPAFESAVNEHLFTRTEYFRDYIVPWVDSAFPITGKRIIEVGCGTGSSTAAFAPFAGMINAFEIDPPSAELADKRFNICGMSNVRLHTIPFSSESTATCGSADIVLLAATIEHMTIDERLSVLSASWHALDPGGVLVVCETPNRLAVSDPHTSFVPFFQQLPHELKLHYLSRSPRADFVHHMSAIAGNKAAAGLALDRWGFGASYHEFECAIGEEIHRSIIADGFEPRIAALHPPNFEETILDTAFTELGIAKHRAFTRRWLFFIAQKT